MEKKNLHISYKATYYKIGNLNSSTKKIWIIFHGYGQLADAFAASFTPLVADDTCLLFPQGLSKFYLKGIDKKIGANWMTAHDRDLDIENYISYLNRLVDMEVKQFSHHIDLNILGFSQGGHTASRWIYHSNIQYQKLILWGTSLANEIDGKCTEQFFSHGKNIIILGDQDKYIDEEQLQKVKAHYAKIGFKYQLVEYHGGHDIYPELLSSFI